MERESHDGTNERDEPMMLNPRIDSTVQVWYRKGLRDHMPLHGATGVVRIASRGKPRNHGIVIRGRFYVVPCGNLRPFTPETS